jgi:hypothetical protein
VTRAERLVLGEVVRASEHVGDAALLRRTVRRLDHDLSVEHLVLGDDEGPLLEDVGAKTLMCRVVGPVETRLEFGAIGWSAMEMA